MLARLYWWAFVIAFAVGIIATTVVIHARQPADCCSKNEDCPDNTYCGEVGSFGQRRCVAGCVSDDQCPKDTHVCVSSIRSCRPKCTTSDQCKLMVESIALSTIKERLDLACVDGACRFLCSSDANCGQGFVCDPEHLVCVQK